MGRFLQEDEYRGDGLNLYAYCDNNPVVYYDPSGYEAICNGENNEIEDPKKDLDSTTNPVFEQYDQVISQYCLRARFYNPAVGRFPQEDEYRGDGLNLYADCRNNPVVYCDPNEYESKDDCIEKGGAVEEPKKSNGDTDDKRVNAYNLSDEEL